MIDLDTVLASEESLQAWVDSVLKAERAQLAANRQLGKREKCALDFRLAAGLSPDAVNRNPVVFNVGRVFDESGKKTNRLWLIRRMWYMDSGVIDEDEETPGFETSATISTAPKSAEEGDWVILQYDATQNCVRGYLIPKALAKTAQGNKSRINATAEWLQEHRGQLLGYEDFHLDIRSSPVEIGFTAEMFHLRYCLKMENLWHPAEFEVAVTRTLASSRNPEWHLGSAIACRDIHGDGTISFEWLDKGHCALSWQLVDDAADPCKNPV